MKRVLLPFEYLVVLGATVFYCIAVTLGVLMAMPFMWIGGKTTRDGFEVLFDSLMPTLPFGDNAGLT